MSIIPIIGFSVSVVAAFGIFPLVACNDTVSQWGKFGAFVASLLSGVAAMYFLLELLQRCP